MNVITIGRDTDNDIVVNDSKVSRHHLQIIKEETGNFRIVDFGSTNGTFVNERKISGETGLSENDVEATVVENPRAECLLGQTVLSHFGKYTIDNQQNEIIFE